MRQHGVVADFTEALGGTDAGAGPVELLLAAVGTCQAMTYRAFATALDIPVGAITVEVEGDMDLRGFLAVDDTVRPGFSALRIMVHMVSAAPAEALDGLGQAANAHCPLLDIVTNGVPVEVTLTHDAP
jgi:uncharacterized OsmC-like protein